MVKVVAQCSRVLSARVVLERTCTMPSDVICGGGLSNKLCDTLGVISEDGLGKELQDAFGRYLR